MKGISLPAVCRENLLPFSCSQLTPALLSCHGIPGFIIHTPLSFILHFFLFELELVVYFTFRGNVLPFFRCSVRENHFIGSTSGRVSQVLGKSLWLKRHDLMNTKRSTIFVSFLCKNNNDWRPIHTTFHLHDNNQLLWYPNFLNPHLGVRLKKNCCHVVVGCGIKHKTRLPDKIWKHSGLLL